MEKMNNVSKNGLIFPSNILPPCFCNEQIFNSIDIFKSEYTDSWGLITRNFKTEGDSIKKFNGIRDITIGVEKGTEPLSVFSAKSDGNIRVFSIANPIIEIPLHMYILENIDKIIDEENLNDDRYISSSLYLYEDGEIFTGYSYEGDEMYEEGAQSVLQSNFETSIRDKYKIADGKYYHLYLDISNFFNSIYTHTISWDLKSQVSKQILSNLDIMIRNLNNNETKGILIGPYTSGIFSELLLSKIDRKILSCINKDVSYIRYVDDMNFYSDSKYTIENEVKYIVEKSLLEFKLDINSSKIKMEEFPFFEMNHMQTKTIFSLKSRIMSNGYKNNLECIEDIIKEIHSSIGKGTKDTNFLFVVLNSIVKNKQLNIDKFENDEIEILLDYLVNTMFKYNIYTQKICQLIINILEYSDLNKIKLIEKWINKRNNQKSNLKEIVDLWLIYIINMSSIKSEKITEYVASIILESDICAILCMDYFYNNALIEEMKSVIKQYITKIEEDIKSRYLSEWKKASWYTKYWLFFYCDSMTWHLHSTQGFGDTILSEVNLTKMGENPEIGSLLSVFATMFNNDIKLIHYDEFEDEEEIEEG